MGHDETTAIEGSKRFGGVACRMTLVRRAARPGRGEARLAGDLLACEPARSCQLCAGCSGIDRALTGCRSAVSGRPLALISSSSQPVRRGTECRCRKRPCCNNAGTIFEVSLGSAQRSWNDFSSLLNDGQEALQLVAVDQDADRVSSGFSFLSSTRAAR